MSGNEWAASLKEERKAKGISQDTLAKRVGISREYLNKIERGVKEPSEKLKQELDAAVGYDYNQAPLFLLVDYVRIRFKTMDVEYVVEKILKIKMKYMGKEDYGYYGYSAHYYIGDIVVLVSMDETKGVLLELKGKGCRQFECYLEAQGRTWYDFFNVCISEKAVMKRLDLAINDRAGILNIPQLIEKCKSGECISVFKSFKDYGSGELVSKREDNRKEMGKTLYIGSMKSKLYFCIYEKAYEQYIKFGTPVEENEIKNRFEIRLKDERAELAVQDLVEHKDGERTAFSIINQYLSFVDRNPLHPERKQSWKVNRDWEYFIGENRDRLKLTTDPQPYELRSTRNWMGHQVSASYKMLSEIDRINGTHFLEDTMKSAKLNKKHKKIIEQATQKVEDVMC